MLVPVTLLCFRSGGEVLHCGHRSPLQDESGSGVSAVSVGTRTVPTQWNGQWFSNSSSTAKGPITLTPSDVTQGAVMVTMEVTQVSGNRGPETPPGTGQGALPGVTAAGFSGGASVSLTWWQAVQ